MFEELIHLHIPNTLGGNGALALIIAVSIFLLIKGADLMVDAAVEVAQDFGLPKLIIGATVVSLGTTSPEACVSVLAAIKGNPGLSIGNGVGSVICDLGLILGLSIMIGRIPINRQILNRQAWVAFGAAMLFAAFAYFSPTRTIVRPMGLILVVCLAVYLYQSYYWARNAQAEEATSSNQQPPDKPGRSMAVSLLWLVSGLVLLIFASHVLIPSVSLSATRLHISEAVIAATIVALGTSLPEFMTAMTAIRKGHPDLALGNLIGADVLNILFVIGVSACAVPLAVDPVFYKIQGPVMIGLLAMFRVFVWCTNDYFKRWQGALLVVGYVLFVSLQYLIPTS